MNCPTWEEMFKDAMEIFFEDVESMLREVAASDAPDGSVVRMYMWLETTPERLVLHCGGDAPPAGQKHLRLLESLGAIRKAIAEKEARGE